MYQALLTRRYLTSKLMPLLASLAVMLCTAMVLVVWSVMGGFLTSLLESGRTFVGDVQITWPTSGFAYYDELVKKLEADPMVAGATPMIETFGLIGFDDGRLEGVSIRGIDPDSYAKVADFKTALWWKPIEEPLPKDALRKDPRLIKEEPWKSVLPRVQQDGLRLAEPDPVTGVLKPAAVLGIEVSRLSERHAEGYYTARDMGQATDKGEVVMRRDFAPSSSINISVLPLDKKGRSIDVASRRFPVANEFRTGIYEIDRGTIFLPLDALQRMLKMDAAERVDGSKPAPDSLEFGPGTKPGREAFPEIPVTGVDPARVTTIWVRAREGVSSLALRDRVEAIYEAFAGEHVGEVPRAELMKLNRLIQTWEQTKAVLVGAVQKETITVLMLLMLISLVASALILSIFWSMVVEKTKDIGILRALGAGSPGVAWLWLRYGLAIGVIGTAMGMTLACTLVWNINPIHEWMGRALNVQVWDPRIYYFTTIPNRINLAHALLVSAMGVSLSVLGALIPAFRAARMDPVRALRFE